ncbi:hypothetical protein [Sphingomonas sp. RS2018]
MKSLCLTAAAAALLVTQGAAAQTCVPQREAEALFLVLAPTAVTSVAQKCAPTLTAGAYLPRAAPRLSAKFAGEADAAWPQARAAIAKIGGADVTPMLDSELGRPMLTAMIGQMVAKEVKPTDCAAIDRVLSLLDPLPARNTVSLLVVLAELAGRNRKTGSFSICPATTR